MDIVVCLKQVPDTSTPIELDPQTNRIRNDGLVYVANPYDRLAVEEAVSVKERWDLGQVTVICMGTLSARSILRSCLALGADRAILLCDPAFEDSDSYATAVVLAKMIRSMEYRLVLCGVRSVDSNAGTVGPVLAEMLSIPLVSEIVEIECVNHEKIRVHKHLEKGTMAILETSIPALLTVEARISEPRYPSLPSLVAAQRKDIEQYDLRALNLSFGEVGPRVSKTKVVGVAAATPRIKKLFTPDSSLSAAERKRLAKSGGITSKAGESLEGEPDEVALKVVHFLRRQKLVPDSD